jgi:uncharacterized protein involved in exopolysaccharide biosynthesis/Mrp family chromosome partitioning ATPase
MPVDPDQKPAFGLNLGDVYYTLFRHKGKILFFTVLGVVAAAALFLTQPPLYKSQAKVFVRYVVESRSFNPAGGDPQGRNDPQLRTPDSQGQNILNSEVELLTSMDLALQVADVIGPEKVLAGLGGGKSRVQAGAVVQRNLLVDAQRHSNVMLVTFQHPDPELVQPVLRQVIDSYFKKHVAVHRKVGISQDYLTKETDRLRVRLQTTEAEILNLKTNKGMLSIEDARRVLSGEEVQIRQELVSAEAELAEHQATAHHMGQAGTAEAGATNVVVAVPADRTAEYRNLMARLDALQIRRADLLLQFTHENPMVKVVEQQMTEVNQQKADLEKQYPSLASVPTATRGALAASVDPAAEALRRIGELQAKIMVLTNRLDKVRTEATTLETDQNTIAQLQRKRDLEESQYRYYSTILEQTRLDENTGAGEVANIDEVQAPTAPAQDLSAILKLIGLCLGGGIGSGLALAFLLEMFLDPTLRRPVDVVKKLHLPMFLSIPLTHRNGTAPSEKAASGKRVPATEQSLVSAILADTPGKRTRAEIAAWDAGHYLRPYHEALRDRLMTYFEVNNLTHKPKLVAVTGCSDGSGVTTLAAGLAATLSETGEGNVLLVDMNVEQGAAHPFFKGRPACNLTDLLEQEKRGSSMIQDRLYMASENPRDRLPNVLPNRFSSLVPKLKASDYDYIIFDMPPISNTSVTPRLARFMDIVLLVVESEKTSHDQAKQASALLTESKANVHAVLNKSRKYVPGWLLQEL